MISGLGPILEPKPLITIRSGEDSLEVDLMASEVDLIEDLFKRFSSTRGDNNSNRNSTSIKSDSSDGPPNRSKIEIHNCCREVRQQKIKYIF